MERDLPEEDSRESETGQFIVLASQAESQADTVEHLPALQQEEEEEGDSDAEIVYPVMDTGAQSGSVILVTDSEAEGTDKQLTSDDARIIEETDSKDNAEVTEGRSSDDAANVTVVAKGGVEEPVDDALSQDLFQPKPDEEESNVVATPSRHVPSLQLSGQPMLVPETMEQSLDDVEVCPSPEVYDNMPLIIPSTPSLTTAAGEESLFNPEEDRTLQSQRQKILEAASSGEADSSSKKQTLASSTSEPGGEGLLGPTLAADVPEWQQSQSLCLRLTSSTSQGSQSSAQQVGDGGQKGAAMNTMTSLSQRLEMRVDDDDTGQSQNLRLCLSQSQDSSQQMAEVFSLSVPKVGPSSQTGKEGEGRAVPPPASNSSSKEDSLELSAGKSFGPPTKAAMSIEMVHSESQSTSETTFRLERPEVSGAEGQVDVEGGNTPHNVFRRTRQGKKAVVSTPGPGISQDSEDFFSYIKKPEKPAEVEQYLSDSDPIPCSQNRPQRQSAKNSGKMEAADTVETLISARTGITDDFYVDTVMDSEPEDEGTQPYEVFPALSRNASPAVMTTIEKMQEDEAQMPDRPPSADSVSPTVPPQHSMETDITPPPAPQQSTALTTSQIAAGQAVDTPPRGAGHSQPAKHASQHVEQSDGKEKGEVEMMEVHTVSAVEGTPGGGTEAKELPKGEAGAPERGLSQKAGHVTRSQTLSQERDSGSRDQGRSTRQGRGTAFHDGSQDSRTKASHPAISASAPSSVSDTSRTTGSKQNPSICAADLAAGTETVSKDVPRSHSQDVAPSARPSLNPGADPFTFHSSQSQVVEGEGATTSRAETSVSTVHMPKSKPRVTLARRRKLLVKKKTEPNPHEPEMKSSSTDEGTLMRGLRKPFKKPRRGNKFTLLQKSGSEFKKPGMPACSAPREEDGDAEQAQVAASASATGGPAAHQSGLSLQPVSSRTSLKRIPDLHSAHHPSSSGAGVDSAIAAGSQGGQALRKRKSVEFGGAVQMGSPSVFSMEQSLSDSQSSDSVMEVTKITEYVLRVVKRRTVIQLFDNEGEMLQEKISEVEDEPELMEENEICKKRRVSAALSPSRSGSTLTSGDLGDISSSSLSAKTGSGPSSLERAASSLELSHPAVLPSTHSLGDVGTASTSASQTGSLWKLGRGSSVSASLIEQMAPERERPVPGGASPAVSFLSPNQSAIERDDSRLEAVVTSSSSARGSEPLYSTDNLPTTEIQCAQQAPPASLSSSSSGIVPPSVDERTPQKRQTATATRSSRKSTRRAPADSSQEEGRQGSKAMTPESQSFLPGSESGGFSVALSGTKKKGSSSSLGSPDKTAQQQTMTSRTRRKSDGSGAAGSSVEEATVASASAQKGKSSQARPQRSSLSSEDATPALVQTVSKLDIGARVMCRWKDGFFYPAKFIGLNTAIGNKFKVLFEDGLEKTVRAVDLVMAQNLPLGQSVLVMGDDGVCDPGIVVRHIVDQSEVKDKDEVIYDIDMDDGSTKRCGRVKLLLSEDQASCLLSDEDYRPTLGETDLAHVNTADVSLDNVIQGKRLRTKGSPAVAVPRYGKPSTSTAASDEDKSPSKEEEQEEDKPGQSQDIEVTPVIESKGQTSSTSKSSTRKRKMGPVATSTPTPKQLRIVSKEQTPKRGSGGSFSSAGVVESPDTQKRPVRRARVGLFENEKEPVATRPDLFSGYTFLLTHVDKNLDTLAQERQQLRDPSIETSADDSTDDGGETPMPFNKDQLTALIEGGGGRVLKKLTPTQVGAGKKLFLISSTYQNTKKYFQCLAANLPSVSHLWVKDSCEQNKLLDKNSYMLPAGISLEKHKLMERVSNCRALAGQRVLLTSSVARFVETWTSVLELAHCKVVSKFPASAAKSRPGVDVVVSDHTCVSSILDKARHLGVPVVSSNWIMQCLINNSLLGHDAHPMYAHDYFKELLSSENTD